MKLILSNWSGFEIDSSEFAILFDVRDTYSALRGFLTSKMVDNKFSKNNILSAFFTAYQIAKKENKEIFERLTASTVNYHDLEYEDKHAKLIEIHDKYIQRCIDFLNSKEELTYIERPWQKISHNRIIEVATDVDKSITKEDAMELIKAIEVLVKQLPHLSFEFYNSYFGFSAKYGTSYDLNVLGLPHVRNFSTEDYEGWVFDDVLKGILRGYEYEAEEY